MKVFILGCGVIGGGMARQLAKHAFELTLFDHKPEFCAQEAKRLGAKAASSPQEAADSDMVILAIKPQDLGEAAHQLKGVLREEHILVSVLAATPADILKKHFAPTQVVRVMPNVALECGRGVFGIVEDPHFDAALREKVAKLLSPMGSLHWIPERLIAGFTAVCGSGPGFLSAIVEALMDGAVQLGFSAHEAQDLVLETVAGTVGLLKAKGCHPGVLRWEVTSPGGLTAQGLRVFEKCGVRSGLMETLQAAAAGKLHNPALDPVANRRTED